MPTRQEVYAAIDSERAYQNRLWPGQYGESKKHELDAFVLYIAGYTNRLIDKASSTDDRRQPGLGRPSHGPRRKVLRLQGHNLSRDDLLARISRQLPSG